MQAAPSTGSDCLRAQDLAGTSDRHEACSAIHRGSEVVTVTFVGDARVDAHPHCDADTVRPTLREEIALYLDRRRQCVGHNSERRTEAVARRGEDHPAVRRDPTPQDLIVTRQCEVHLLVALLPEARRSLDISEEKRHQAAWKPLHYPQSAKAQCHRRTRPGRAPRRTTALTQVGPDPIGPMWLRDPSA